MMAFPNKCNKLAKRDKKIKIFGSAIDYALRIQEWQEGYYVVEDTPTTIGCLGGEIKELIERTR